MLDKSELQQLNTAWKVIGIIWGALFASLAIHVAVCYLVEDQLVPEAGFPLETMRFALYGVSAATLVVAYYLRRAMLKPGKRSSPSTAGHRPAAQIQHPAAGKYLTAMIVASALSESIGIYGVVLFFLSKDWSALYQFMIVSAAAMLYFRPRKEELFGLAEEMKRQPANQTVPRSHAAG